MNESSKPVLVRYTGTLLAALAIGVLLICLFYVFAYVLAPYPGFEHDTQWLVLSFDNVCETHPSWCAANQGSLQIGDQLLVIGDLTYDEYRTDRILVPFAGYKPGDWIPIKLMRDGITLETRWQMLGPTPARQLVRWSVMLPFLPFWLAGTLVLLFLRPRDVRWRLLVAFNYLTAVWWATGAASSTRVAASSLVLHAVTWWLVPAYLHLHLLVPTPLLIRHRRYLLPPLYALAALLAGLELIQALPPKAFYLGMFLAGVGSLGLLFARLFMRASPLARLAVGQMLAGIALAFGPGIALWVVPGLLHAPQSGALNIYLMSFAASLLPFFYIYAPYKRLLGDLEFRANRALSLFSFLVVYLTAFVVVFVVGAQRVSFTPAALGFALTVSMLFVTGGLFLRAPFQRLLDRLAYGTEHNPDDILRAFANEIPRALNRDALIRLLTREVGPSLLIRQSALYLWKDGQASLFYADGVALDPEVDASEQVRQWLAGAKRYRPPKSELGEVSPEEQEADWVRLAIPVEVGNTVLGIWLFGQRNPDDFYPKPDIELLATLANQVGVALETMRLIEDLRQQASALEKAYEELKELDRLKDEFIQNVSHELRTPLAVIRGYTDLFLEGLLGGVSSEQQQALQIMSDRIDALTRLINDVLSFQQGATLPLVREPIYLTELAQFCIRNAEALVQKMGRKEQFRFVLEASEDLPVIWGDYNRLSQVFDHLLSNAIKFSPEGGTITVRIHPCTYHFVSQSNRGQSAIQVSISDQGIGIPADQIQRIWERFYQVDGSSTRRFGGTGIGLTIARNIVQAHGGAIWAESKIGVGSTFHFVLPVQEPLVSSEGEGTYRSVPTPYQKA